MCDFSLPRQFAGIQTKDPLRKYTLNVNRKIERIVYCLHLSTLDSFVCRSVSVHTVMCVTCGRVTGAAVVNLSAVALILRRSGRFSFSIAQR